MLKTFKCTSNWDPYHHFIYIHGNTLREAVKANIDTILSHNNACSCTCRLTDYRLEYSPGILGGRGGVKVIMDCVEHTNPPRPVVVEGWIEATPEDLDPAT